MSIDIKTVTPLGLAEYHNSMWEDIRERRSNATTRHLCALIVLAYARCCHHGETEAKDLYDTFIGEVLDHPALK